MPLNLLQQGREEFALYSASTFRRLLDSLARPGKINQLEYPTSLGEPPSNHFSVAEIPLNFYALGALATLLDGETSFILAAGGQWLDQSAPPVRWLASRSGGKVGRPGAVDFAFFCDGRSSGLLAELHMGTLLEPESSATAFYCVERLVGPVLDGGTGLDNDAVTLKLRGPGIQELRTVSVSGLNVEEVKLMQATRKGFPLGIDIYLIDVNGQCLGLPRTTKIEIPDVTTVTG